MALGLTLLAVMAALNLTYDLLRAENRAQGSESLNEDLSRIDAQLDEALARFQQPEL